ncbi:MAG: beta-lactamase family protein [Candidatus Aminicenantes bacterium]|nr:beta-lactamase family protein [Candidatus Aminicenantes bacterium]
MKRERAGRRRYDWPNWLLVLAAVGTLLAGQACVASKTTAPAIAPAPAALVFPEAEWEIVADPERAGYSQAGLEAAREYLKTLPTTGLVVVAGGRIVLEYGDVIELSYLASVRKSVLAMLFGNYVASGKVRLGKTLAELGITDHGGLSAQEQEATIADLLAARSGVYHPASNSGDNLADAPPRGSQKHGQHFLYSNWDFNALGTIFEQETGRNIYDALESDLARPIGMQDFKREAQRKTGDLKKSMHPAYHIWLSTRDMARLGYLMLREGNWAGKQLVPRDWVKKITSPVTRLEEMNPAPFRKGRLGYGYLWWVFDGPEAVGPYEGAYTGSGAGGQFITVVPKLDLVIAHKTNLARSKNQRVAWKQYAEFLDRIIAARLAK